MSQPRGPFSLGRVAVLLVAAVLLPTLASISAGIVALALWKNAADIVVGVLVICFAAMVVGGTLAALLLLRRWNRLAGLQADFVANISHELRTPLTSIRLLVETLRLGRARDAEQVRDCLDALARETERLSSLVERALQWRRLEADGTRLVRRPEAPEAIVADALAPLTGPLSSGAQRIALEADAPVGRVLADRQAMADALRNVVHNALQYGDPDSPVKVRLGPDPSGRAVTIEVQDHGPGIPKEELSLVFDRFYRGVASRRDPSRTGTGLGLSIARRIVEDHGGRIQVESHAGWGTRVRVTLPVTPLELGDEGSAEAAGGAHWTAALLQEEPPAGAEPSGDGGPESEDGEGSGEDRSPSEELEREPR